MTMFKTIILTLLIVIPSQPTQADIPNSLLNPKATLIQIVPNSGLAWTDFDVCSDKIAFTRSDTVSKDHAIVIYNMKTDTYEDISFPNGRYPTFSPCGTKIAFGRNSEELYIGDLATGAESLEYSGYVRQPMWSPCENLIAFLTKTTDSCW